MDADDELEEGFGGIEGDERAERAGQQRGARQRGRKARASGFVEMGPEITVVLEVIPLQLTITITITMTISMKIGARGEAYGDADEVDEVAERLFVAINGELIAFRLVIWFSGVDIDGEELVGELLFEFLEESHGVIIIIRHELFDGVAEALDVKCGLVMIFRAGYTAGDASAGGSGPRIRWRLEI